MEKLFRKINNKFLKIRCRLVRATQKPIWPDMSKGYLTIFYDYEGDYALPSKERAEASLYGVRRTLEICRKNDIKATFNTVGKLFYDHPDIIRQIIADGHNIASHSFKHDDISRLSRKEIDTDIKLTQEAFKVVGLKLRGMSSPQNRWSFKQMDVMLKNGLCWSAEPDEAPHPYIMRKKGAQILVRIPINFNDYNFYISRKFPANKMYDTLIEAVTHIHDSKVFGAIGFHPWVNGLDESRLDAMDRFFKHVSSMPNLEIITFDQAWKTIASCKNFKKGSCQ